MKLLIITQKINKDDHWLSFFERWVAEFATHFESIKVICLEVGRHDLPSNVSVFSLGKETKQSRGRYLSRFFSEIIRTRHEYDAVFVHMNQEYVLLAGWLWRLWGKRVYMWRNHHAGSMLTDIAAAFCTNVFCTSKFSYTAKYPKTILMPVGIDTSFFQPDPKVIRTPKSILFFGRVAPSKRPDLFVEVLGDLKQKGSAFSASLQGDSLPKDAAYHESLKTRAKEIGLSTQNSFDGAAETTIGATITREITVSTANQLRFFPGTPNRDTPAVFSAYEIFVNLSSSGMYDKMIFEAMACGALVLASNKNLHGLIDERFIFAEGDRLELAEKLEKLLSLSDAERAIASAGLRSIVEKHHSLQSLATKLAEIIQ
jgi:glycosyltransferase involved in cell wall biosynthesis